MNKYLKLKVLEEIENIEWDDQCIEDAFCWEGHASLSIDTMTIDDDNIEVTINVRGTSTVEHSGDVSGIYGQVDDLNNQEGRVMVGNTLFIFCIKHTSCNITEELKEGDGDYEIHVKGTVRIRITSE